MTTAEAASRNDQDATGGGGVDVVENNERPIVRLSVNLAPDVADVLKRWSKGKGLSITEGVRRAIAVWNFLETARQDGQRFALIEDTRDGERIREVVLVD